jgi:hypothetical protein
MPAQPSNRANREALGLLPDTGLTDSEKTRINDYLSDVIRI